MTVTAPRVAEAVESTASHLHPVASFDLADHPVPTGREEVWRFTPMKRIAGLLEGEPSNAQLRWTVGLPDGVTSADITCEEAAVRGAFPPVDRAAAVATSGASGARHLSIPDNAHLTEPITIDLHGEAADATVYGQTLVTVGAHARATIVVRHTGSGSYASSVSVLVSDGADITFVSVQDWEGDAVHAGHTGFRIGRDATVKTVTVSIGGDIVRLVETAEYDGPGGDLQQFGLYFVDAGQHIEHRLFVDHNAPHTQSHVDYRGALQGDGAHSVWVGDVLIRPVAEGITTYETNKNLVLTDGCRADSVPNLEIETGEIEGAGHSSTTGRFDDEQLFYLRSRGIPEDEARRLVVRGFFADIIRHIGVTELEDHLIDVVERELARAVTGGGETA